MQNPQNVHADELVFRGFFIAAEAARLAPELRSAIPVVDVLLCVRRFLPSVASRSHVPSIERNGEDLIQEFFCEAFGRGLTLYTESFSFTQYAAFILFRAANCEKKLHRQGDRRRSLAEAAFIEDAALNIPERIHQLQTYREVLDVLKELGVKLKDSCQEVWGKERAVADTARMIEATPNAVRMHLHRARNEVL